MARFARNTLASNFHCGSSLAKGSVASAMKTINPPQTPAPSKITHTRMRRNGVMIDRKGRLCQNATTKSVAKKNGTKVASETKLLSQCGESVDCPANNAMIAPPTIHIPMINNVPTK